MEKTAEELLAKKFEIVESVIIPRDQRLKVALWLRGGSWGEGRDRKLLLPYKIIRCIDHHWTQPMAANEQFPHVDNEQFFYKHHVRELLCTEAGRKIYGIHGSDNRLEARYMKSIWRKFLHDQSPARLI